MRPIQRVISAGFATAAIAAAMLPAVTGEAVSPGSHAAASAPAPAPAADAPPVFVSLLAAWDPAAGEGPHRR